MRRIFICTAALLLLCSALARGGEIVVSATPDNFQKALRKARESLKKQKDVVLELSDGVYRLGEPLVLDESFNPSEGCTFTIRAAAGASSVISGGVEVKGWVREEGNLFSAPLQCDHKLRSLFVGGERAVMASSSEPSDGLGVASRFSISGSETWAFGAGEGVEGIRIKASGELAAFRNPEDVEMVQSKTWTEKILCLEDFRKDPDGNFTAVLQQPLGAIINSMAWAGKIDYRGKFLIRNALELLDEPGEFYFDRAAQRLYYMSDGRNPEELGVIAPVCEGLLRICGSSCSSRVHDIALEGLHLAYDAWNLMELEGSRGFGGIQSLAMAVRYIPDGNWHPTRYNSCDVPEGSVDVRNASGIRVQRCVFEHLGSATAVGMTNDVVSSSIVGCEFRDLLGNSLTLGHPQHYEIGDAQGRYPAGVEGLCRDIEVSNNLLRDVCLDFRQAEAMVAFFVNSVSFLHNDILDCPYGAIALGWWWGNAGIPECSLAGGNRIAYNRIGRTNRVLSDGGPIYLLGKQPGSVVEWNYIFSSPRCIYPDDGSSGWSIHHNFVDSVYQYWLHIASDRDYNISVHDNYVKDNALVNDGLGIEVLRTENFRNRPFSAAALQIKENSGLEEAYRR